MNGLENKTNFVELISEVVNHLEGFKISEIDLSSGQSEYWIKATHGDGRCLDFMRNCYNNKIGISGVYGLDAYGRYAGPINFGSIKYNQKRPDSIGVSVTKSAEKIADDIKRRLLPTYSELYYKIAERIAKDKEKSNTVNQRITEIADLIDSDDIQGKSNYTKTVYFSSKSIHRGEIRTSNGEDYAIEITGVPHVITLAIAQLLKNSVAKTP